MKIVLIYPGVILTANEMEREYKKVPTINLPLGILYLGQILKDNGHKVLLYDHYVSQKPIKEVLDWLKKVNPEVVGFSVLSANLSTANAIAKEAKAWNPNLTIVYGGYLATFCSAQILRNCEYVDFCVRGEGERTFIELLDALEKNKSVKDILGISYKDNGKLTDNPDRPLIENLDSIKFPDRKLIRQTYQFYGKVTTIISSRGCPFACRFCSCWKFSRGKLRLRSVENIIEEMLYLQADGYNELIFTDDCFNAKPRRILHLCHLMKKEKLDFAWHSTGRVSQSNAQLLRTMVETGCKTLTYGIESANQRILDYYNKRITPDMALTAVSNAKKAGIENIGAGFIIGAPTETSEEIKDTIRFGINLQRYGLTNLQFQILFVSPGTALFNEFVERGYINPEIDWAKEIPAIERIPNAVSRSYLEMLSKRAFKDFVINKRFLISEYLKSIKSHYRMQMVTRLLGPRQTNF
jgi:anaerobic magnesium-protoporphyrin IX monomethyl ester cyclase